MTNQDYLQAVQFLNEALARRPRPDCLICGNDRVVLVAYQHLLSVGLSTSLSVHGKGFLLGWLCHGLPVDGNSGNTKWVLVVNVNPSAVASGSGAQYFIGKFDSKQFTAEDILDASSLPPGTLFQSFEGPAGTTFASLGWTATGDFVGRDPVTTTGPSWVTGFIGTNYVDAFSNTSDTLEGTATSPQFTVENQYINLLVGGGDHPYAPNASYGAEPAGKLLFPGADLEFAVPGTTHEQLAWVVTGDLVNQPTITLFAAIVELKAPEAEASELACSHWNTRAIDGQRDIL
jgi:hypothetical protein